MIGTRRRGDAAGIGFLIALVAAAFIPSTLDEAGRIVERLREVRAAQGPRLSSADAVWAAIVESDLRRLRFSLDLEREPHAQVGVASTTCREPAIQAMPGAPLGSLAWLPLPLSGERRREPRGPPFR